jgi:hypothetical protein
MEGLERRLFGGSDASHSEWARAAAPVAAAVPWSRALVVNATGHDPMELPAEVRQGIVLSPTFEGHFAVESLGGPLIRPGSPSIGVVITRGERSWPLASAQLAIERPVVVAHALDRVLGQTIVLLRQATEVVLEEPPQPDPQPAPPAAVVPSRARYGAEWLFHAAAPKLGQKLLSPVLREDWRIGYRRQADDGPPWQASMAPESFRLIEPPWSCFYADPFVAEHDGLIALFFEDYEFADSKGRISFVLLHPDGSHSAPARALERPYHLSYPFVFHHEGAALMIPETGANRTIELYEARSFPHDWRLRAVLMEDIEARDATLYFDAARATWWMFAAVSEFGASANETLSIFHSERLEGPWRAHARNPVKLAAGSSRPAGPLVRRGERLFRPAQNCATGYGGGIVWCEIDELGPAVFREHAVAQQEPPPGYTGLHTFARAAGFEVVDFKRRRPRLASSGVSRRRSSRPAGSRAARS